MEAPGNSRFSKKSSSGRTVWSHVGQVLQAWDLGDQPQMVIGSVSVYFLERQRNLWTGIIYLSVEKRDTGFEDSVPCLYLVLLSTFLHHSQAVM